MKWKDSQMSKLPVVNPKLSKVRFNIRDHCLCHCSFDVKIMRVIWWYNLTWQAIFQTRYYSNSDCLFNQLEIEVQRLCTCPTATGRLGGHFSLRWLDAILLAGSNLIIFEMPSQPRLVRKLAHRVYDTLWDACAICYTSQYRQVVYRFTAARLPICACLSDLCVARTRI